MSEYSAHVGLDVHKDAVAVAVAWPGRGEIAHWRGLPWPGCETRLKDGIALAVCWRS